MLNRILTRLRELLFKRSTDVDSHESGATPADAQNLLESDSYPIAVADVEDHDDPECRTHFVQCASATGLHRMAYHEWGDSHNPKVLICVHGLTRRGSDFNVLAKAMAKDYRVICPDVVGRGESDWLENPKQPKLQMLPNQPKHPALRYRHDSLT